MNLSTIKRINFRRKTGKEKKYPTILQLPITYNCNSKCKICNIWKINEHEITIYEFKIITNDKIFSKIETVGINGGEPSQLVNLTEYVQIIVNNMPNLKSVNLISNGFDTEKIISTLKRIYLICNKKKIKFHISISLDGIKEIHEISRGTKGCYKKTLDTITKIKNNLNYIANSYDVACTISKLNVEHLVEFHNYCLINNINIKYRMAVDIERLKNKKIYNEFNAFDEYSAREFIFRMYKESKNLSEKFRYFSIFTSIISKRNNRLAGCYWKDDGITLDPYGNIFYCAVRSKPIGNLLKNKGRDIFFSRKNIKYREEIVKSCNECAHDYSGKIPIISLIFLLKNLIDEKIWTIKYSIKRFLL